MSDEAHPHEIIIIKRHAGGHEDGHHGGAWKIAYADFVTAMMAFFLVMWLLSANEKTKASIVKYFNPVHLVDSTPQPPGLSDPSEKTPQPKLKTGTKAETDSKDAPVEQAGPRDKPSSRESGEKDAKPSEGKSKEEAALMRDPYAVLTEIAARDGESARTSKGMADGAKAPVDGTKGGAGPAGGAAGALGGEAFRDPFEPGPATTDDAHDAPPPVVRANAAAPDPTAAPLPAEPAARAAELKNRIDALLKSVAAASAGPGPKVDVRATPEGVLIGLTDDARFAMFASASARPAPRTVTLMEKIGKLLDAQKGRVVIRGYTDSRKYKSDTYDNWRLSSARAHMAHYMLARGGLDEARVERIEGYADRQPRNAKDPESPENRRIEILVRPAP